MLDECLPVDFRHHLPGHDAHTAQWAGFKGLKNGQLLRQAELAGYDAFLTVDQGVPHQQNLEGRKISVVVICPQTNQMKDLLPVIDAILAALAEVQPGQIAFAS